MSADNYSSDDLILTDLVIENPGPEHMTAMIAVAKLRVDQIQRRERRIKHTGIGGFLGGLIAVTLLLVPVSYDVTVGTKLEVVWSMPDAAVSEVEPDLAALDGLVARKFGFKDDIVTGSLVFRNRVGDLAKQDVRSVLIAHLPDGVVPTITFEEIKRRVGGNALAALTNVYLKINAVGLTHREVELVIMEELGLMGMVNPEATITQDNNGSISIEVKMESSPVDSFTFEVTF